MRNEGKSQLTNRLRREGRWGQASAYKDNRVRELRSTGINAAQARELAWEEMEAKYPPLEVPEKDHQQGGIGLDMSPLKLTAEEFASLPNELVNYGHDVFWVYQNLGEQDIQLEDIPNSGAVALLNWARKNPNAFLTKILFKTLTHPKKQDDRPDQDQKNLDSQKQLAYFRELLGFK